MSSGSLFDTESKKSSNWKMFLIGALVLLVVFSTAFGLYWRSLPKEKTAAEFRAEELRDATVMMLAQPTFSGAEFEKQVLGKANFEWLDMKKREIYFSYPPAEESEFEEFLGRYFVRRDRIELGRSQGRNVMIGEYGRTLSAEVGYFFKTNLENFRVDPDLNLKFPFRTVEYAMNLDEMKGFTDNSKVYGGKLLAEAATSKNQPKIVFANHGIMVAKPGEPTLKRLVDELLRDESIGDNREKRVQRLVDFVSGEIEYSFTEAVAPRETLKRANEVLMTRIGDCSNKTILLASLLEQIGEDYILLYSPRHITVGVAEGAFPNENKLDFVYENRKYLIAETTLPNFQIGLTRVAEADRLVNVDYVQQPRQIDLIFDARSYKYLNFW